MRAVIAKAKAAAGRGTGGKVDALVGTTRDRFYAAMDDDFDTPTAIYRLRQMTEALASIEDMSAEEGRAVLVLFREAGQVLGLFQELG